MAHPVSLEAIEALKAEITSRIASTSAMFDRLDTTNWPPKDIRTYQALLEEKRQLEKDHHKLALDDVSRPSQRKVTRADLHNEPDDFRYDTETGGYKYVGLGPCAIDKDVRKPCHHETCRQAVHEGLSYMQYTTVRHYEARITAAKTSRMKEALRKQRDGQLLKDKEAEAEFKDKAMKKFKSMGKEAGESIAAAAASLFPNSECANAVNGELEREEDLDTPYERIGRELSALRAKDLPDTSQVFANTVLARLIDDKVWHSWRDSTPYVEYFSKMRISHLHAAVFLLRDVLELNAIYSYELDTGLRTFVDDVKTGLKHVPVKFKSSVSLTVAEALHQIKGHINPEHPQPIADLVPDGPMRRLLEACIVVEDNARQEFWDVAHLAVQKLIDPEKELNAIRDVALAKSALPSVSVKQLKLNMAHVRNYCIIHTLIRRAIQGENSAALSNAMINYVKTMAENRAERYLDVLDDIEIVFDDLCEVIGEGAIPNEHQQLMACLFDTVQHPIGDEIRRERDLLHDRSVKNDNAVTTYLNKIRETLPLRPDTFPGMDDDSSADVMRQYMRIILEVKDDAELLRDRFIGVMRDNVWRGISEAFIVFRYCKNDQPFHCDSHVFDLCKHQPERVISMFTKEGKGILTFFVKAFRDGWCLPAAFVRLTTILPYLSSLSPASAKAVLGRLARVVRTSSKCLPENWNTSLAHFGPLLLHTYGYFMVEFMTLLGRSDVEQIALTMANILFLHVFMQPTKERAEDNLQYIMTWLRFLLNPRGAQRAEIWLQKITTDFRVVFENVVYLCSTPDACMWYAEKHAEVDSRSLPLMSLNLEIDQSSATVSNAQSSHASATNNSTSKTDTQQQFQPLDGFSSVTIHETRSVGRTTNSLRKSLRNHDEVLDELLREQDFSELISAKVMKYCALRLKLWKESSQPLDYISLDKLYKLFGRAEKRPIHLPDYPCSNIQNTRNHCDIWELMEFREKIIGFFTGYKYSFRDVDDIANLAQSILHFAMQGDLCWSMKEVYDLKVTHLKGIAGGLWPPGADKMFGRVAKEAERAQERPDIRLQLSVNRRDYILWTQSQHEKPTFQFFYDLASESLEIFKDYVKNMEIEHEIMGEVKEQQEVRTAMLEVIELVESNQLDEVETGPLGKLSAYAVHSMMTRNHDDTIFSSDDDTEDDYEEEEQPVVAEIAYRENYQKPAYTQVQHPHRTTSSQTDSETQAAAVDILSSSQQEPKVTSDQDPDSISEHVYPSTDASLTELASYANASTQTLTNLDDAKLMRELKDTIGNTADTNNIQTVSVRDRRILTPKSRVIRSPDFENGTSPTQEEEIFYAEQAAGTIEDLATPDQDLILSCPPEFDAIKELFNLTPSDLQILANSGYDREFFDLSRPVTPGLLDRLKTAVRSAYQKNTTIPNGTSKDISQLTSYSPMHSSEPDPINHLPHTNLSNSTYPPPQSTIDPQTASHTPSTTGPRYSALASSLSRLTNSVANLDNHLTTPPEGVPDTEPMRAAINDVFRPVSQQLRKLNGQCAEMRLWIEARQRAEMAEARIA